ENLTQGVGSDDIKDEFGKILGRFDPEYNRISLESTDAAYITQKRVLEKNASGAVELSKLYRSNQDAIELQFKLNHDLYKGYETEEDFILAYPFVPYQFRLISNVFESFQNRGYVIKEVKDNERSILGITHYTAKVYASEKEVGQFVPFDAFFNNQFTSNLQHAGSRAIDPALSLDYVKNNEFAARIVKTLFLVSNLSDKVQQTFPPNVDNLVILIMKKVDENRLELQQKVGEVLDNLIKESIIREEDGNYYFFNEDEIDVTNEIKNTVPGFDKKLEELGKLVLPSLNASKKFSFRNNDFSISLFVDEKNFFRGSDAEVRLNLFDNKKPAEIALGNRNDTLVFCLNTWYNSDNEFKRDFDRYIKTVDYLIRNSDYATGQRRETLDNFRTRNNTLKDQLEKKLKEEFLSCDMVSGASVIDASRITGSIPREKYNRALDLHFSHIYKHIELSESYVNTASALRQKLSADSSQTSFDTTPTEAEGLINDFISSSGNEITVSGDAAKYPGKVHLIAGAFHDAVNAVNAAKTYIDPQANAMGTVSTYADKLKPKAATVWKRYEKE
ncbi:MAG: hypothetical protein R6U02_09060, partial [Alkalibacterium sp.]